MKEMKESYIYILRGTKNDESQALVNVTLMGDQNSSRISALGMIPSF